MEIATTLNNAIQQMNSKRDEINEKILTETTEIKNLTSEMNKIEERIESLTESLSKSETELLQLNNTITETEAGYQKLVAAGETLMSIVSQNLPKVLSNAPDNASAPDNATALDAFKNR